MNRFFAYISRMKYIRRWGLMASSREENVQEHSLQVAMFVHGLALLENKFYNGQFDPEHLMALAVYHETAEVITGDLVTPIKYYNEEMRSVYKKIEKQAEERMLEMLPEELQEDFRPLVQPKDEQERALLKAADTLASYTKCLEELRLGNREFEKAKNAIQKKLEASPFQSVHYFMEHFIPAFEITLDELN